MERSLHESTIEHSTKLPHCEWIQRPMVDMRKLNSSPIGHSVQFISITTNQEIIKNLLFLVTLLIQMLLVVT